MIGLITILVSLTMLLSFPGATMDDSRPEITREAEWTVLFYM